MYKPNEEKSILEAKERRKLFIFPFQYYNIPCGDLTREDIPEALKFMEIPIEGKTLELTKDNLSTSFVDYITIRLIV